MPPARQVLKAYKVPRVLMELQVFKVWQAPRVLKDCKVLPEMMVLQEQQALKV